MGVLVGAFNEILSRIEARDEELRQALADREDANRHLAESNADLERFAFVASHDLQEPLRMVTLYTQLLQKRLLIDSGNEASEYVNNITDGTRRMRELLNDLRAYAEIRAEAEIAPVDLNTAVAKARANLQLAIESSGAEITADKLPWLKAYEAHFVALFQNLIGNAIKYRKDEVPRMHISFRHEAGSLQFAVADNGVGIAPEYQNVIFVPFKRLHGREIPGSGIGLAICQRVVDRYGGRIWVESEVNRGATFLFTLPEAALAPAPEFRRSTA
jgi:light-regulated signal transduction histidine kinase (bacteriophytochrome)